MMVKSLMVAALALAFATPLAAQGDTLFCAVPHDADPGVTWPPDSTGDMGAMPSTARVRALMSGQFRMIVVTTEGENTYSSEWLDLRLFPTDSIGLKMCHAALCAKEMENPLVGVAGPGLSRLDSLTLMANGRVTRPAYRLRITPSRRQALLSDWIGIDSGGPLYEIREVATNGFAGRWSDGSVAVYPVTRGGITTYERLGGYFCAWRVNSGSPAPGRKG